MFWTKNQIVKKFCVFEENQKTKMIKSCYIFEINEVEKIAFSVVTVNDNHTKLRLERKLRVKFQDDICTKLRLKLLFGNDCYFCHITESEWF